MPFGTKVTIEPDLYRKYSEFNDWDNGSLTMKDRYMYLRTSEAKLKQKKYEIIAVSSRCSDFINISKSDVDIHDIIHFLTKGFKDNLKYSQEFTKYISKKIFKHNPILNVISLNIFVRFYLSMIEIFSKVDFDEHLMFTLDGVRRKLSKSFSSKKAAICKFNEILQKLQQQNGQFDSLIHFNPFSDLNKAPEKDKIFIYFALYVWGIEGYRYIARMCFTAEEINAGLCKTVEEGQAIIQFCKENGCDIGQTHHPMDVEQRFFFSLSTESYRHHEVINYGTHHRFRLPSFRTIQEQKNPEILAEYLQVLESYLGVIVKRQISIYIGAYMMSLSRELASIESIISMKHKINNQILALVILMGVSLCEILFTYVF